MEGQALTWTDDFGRTHEYTPHRANHIGDEGVEFSSDATLAIAEASSSLGSVPALPAAGIAAVLYRSESSASSLIEGVGPGPRRILAAEVAGKEEIDDEAALRVVSNLEALRDAMELALPIKPEDMLRWHRKLMVGHPTMPPDSIGSFRTQQNWIGGDASGPRRAEFIPPRPEDVPDLIDDLVTFCARTDLAPVAHAAIAHARFEVVHPFLDGNGRVGRLFIQPLLRRRHDLPSPVPVSVIWSQNTDRYLAGLRSYQSGDVNSWLEFFSVTIVQAVAWMTQFSERILTLVADFHGRIATRGESVTARIIDDLPEHPILDSQAVAERYGVTPQSAHAALVRLEEAGILRERDFARRRRGRPRKTFAATELIDLLV
jgi:Fic family protein